MKNKRFMFQAKTVLVLMLAAMYMFVGCTGKTTPSTEGTGSSGGSGVEQRNGTKKLQVVTTIFPPYDFVKAIGRDKVEVTMLLAPGMESHTYEPTPADIKMISSADLFIHTGSANDTWVESVVPENVKRLEMMNCVNLLTETHDHDGHNHGKEGEGHDHGNHDHDHDHHNEGHNHDHDGHNHDHPDEHVWTSPVNAVQIVNAIAEELTVLDPANKEFYMSNAETYKNELENLDKDYRILLDSSERTFIVFADRFPFRYLANEYGIEFVAAFSGCSTETEVSASVVAELIEEVKEHHLPAVFKMEFSNDGIARAVAEASGAKILEMHSVHNLTAEEIQNGENYLTLMRKNLEALREALN